MKKKYLILMSLICLILAFGIFMVLKNKPQPTDNMDDENIISSIEEISSEIQEATIEITETVSEEQTQEHSMIQKVSEEESSVETPTADVSKITNGDMWVIILGDSRACSMSNSLFADSTWTLIKDGRIAPDQGWCIFEKNDIKLSICEYGGGNLQNGAYDKCIKWAKEVISTNDTTSSTCFCIFDIFGLGDVASGFFPDSPSFYNEKNQAFANSLSRNCVYYQCTVGPIDEAGSIGRAGLWTNEIIKKNNTHFQPTADVKLFDLYSFLEKSGYQCNITEGDPTGVHYNYETDSKIIDKFFSIAKTEEYYN